MVRLACSAPSMPSGPPPAGCLALLHVSDAPAARADRPIDDLARALRARLRARNELRAVIAALAVLRLVLVLHRLLARLRLREGRAREPRRGGEPGGHVLKPAATGRFHPPVTAKGRAGSVDSLRGRAQDESRRAYA